VKSPKVHPYQVARVFFPRSRIFQPKAVTIQVAQVLAIDVDYSAKALESH
jgi:hypothetical protein